MNCKHCGYPVNRGQKTCPSCGRKVRRGKGWGILLLIVLLLAAAVFGVLHYRDVFNRVAERRLDLLSYYRYVEEQNYDDLAGLASRLAGKKTVVSLPGGHSGIRIGFRLSDQAQSMLSQVKVAGFSLDWIRSLGLDLETNADGGLIGALLELKLNDVGLLSVNAAVDRDRGALALHVPELSEQTVLTTLGELGPGGEDSGLGELLGTLGSLPDTSKLREIGRRYLEYALEQVENVEKGSGTLTASGLETDCTTLTVRMTDEELVALARSLCQKLSGDEEVLALAEETATAKGEDPESARSALIARLNRLDGLLGKTRAGKGTFAMVLSLDDGGRILGREIRFESERDETVYSRALLVRGARFGLEIRGGSAQRSAGLTGSGRLRGLGLTASFSAEIDSAPMITLDVDASLKGFAKGEIEAVLAPERALLRALGVSEETESLAKDVNLRFRFSNAEDPKTVALELRSGTDVLATVDASHYSLPSEEVVFPETVLGLNEWLGGIKMPSIFGNGSFGTLFDNFKQAGVPDGLITGMKLLLPGLLK